MSIFTKRLQLTPPEYDWAKEQFEVALQNAWSHTEVQMQSDLMHWKSPLITDTDRQAIAGILRGFTVIEEVVGDQWTNLAHIFPKPEIMAMCKTFAEQEWVHAYAYDLLETTLGIADENWAAFQKDKNAQNKLAAYTNILDYVAAKSDGDVEYLALPASEYKRKLISQGIAIFGGCAEGVSLFGSFAILLSYCKASLFPGMMQILSWSVRDEDLHSICAIQLYHEFVKAYPEAKINEEVAHTVFESAVELESKFIQPSFSNGALTNGLTFEDALAFIKHRANLKLNQLGFSNLYSDAEVENSIAEWFYPLTKSTPIHDFFIQRANGGAYAAKLKQDFVNIDYSQF